MWWKKQPKRIYLDYAAATPVRQEVLSCMRPFWQDKFANASAIHQEGVGARQTIDQSRRSVARLLGVREAGVVFTGSGTESNQLAIQGLVKAATEDGRNFSDCEMITTKTQHPSVLETVGYLSRQGLKVNYCPVDETGKVDQAAFSKLLTKNTVLVTLAYANSETGTVEDIRKISRLVRDFNRHQQADIKLHTDAAQAPLWLNCRLEDLGVDLLSLDAGKCYGPKGVGVLAFQHKVALAGMLLGGGQEFGLRASTENVAGIVGMTAALELAQTRYQERSAKVTPLRDRLITELIALEGVVLNGPIDSRLANNVNLSILGVDSEFVVICLDAAGIAASTRSACSGGHSGGSYVVREMTGDAARANSTIRLSLGEETTLAEVKRTIKALTSIIIKQQKFVSSLEK